MKDLLGWLPLRRTLAGYRREWLAADAIAGISVCVVAVPSVVAYSALVGLPPVTGLYAALLGMIGYALFTSSRQVIAGPDAALALLVGAAIAPLTAGDSDRAAFLAAAIAILAALLLLATAVARAGIFADLLSKPVLVGYLTGAALILISTQLGKFFGISIRSSDFFDVLGELWRRSSEVHLLTLFLGLGFVAVQAALRLLAPKAPSAIVVFALAIAGAYLFDLEGRGVALVGAVPSGLPRPKLPGIQLADLQQILPAAVGVALLAMPECILLARAFAARHNDTIRPNQEIVALGASNLLAGLFQGFPVGASQSRTTVNSASGGRTPISGLIAAGGILIILLFLTPLLALLPTVALAAILIVAGVGLIELHEYRAMLRFHWRALMLALLVMFGVLIAGVLYGILLGVVVSLLYVLGRLARPLDSVLREIPGQRRYHDLNEVGEEPAETVPGLIAYRFYSPLLFANAEWFVTRVRTLVDRSPSPVRWFVLDAQAIWSIDLTASEALGRLAAELKERGITFKIARANRPLREVLRRGNVFGLVGEENFYPSVHAAVHEFLESGSA